MNPNYLDFEQPIAELEAKIEELRHVSADTDLNIGEEIARLEAKNQELTARIFKSLTSWQIAQLARHPLRPHSLDYIQRIFTEWDELHGDRTFSDDPAIVSGIARLDGKPVVVIGQQKGRDTQEKVRRNFGMPQPDGYRKALRMFKLAERFSMPVITLIDTPGAYPGVGAEARGQSEAIARNLFEMAQLRTPIVCVVIGEGASGGALGIGVGDTILMLENAYYATISPEGCASILWKSAEKAPEAAEIMSITAQKLKDHNLIDEIVPEPLGGAHRDVDRMAITLKDKLVANIERLSQLSIDALLKQRYQRYRDIA